MIRRIGLFGGTFDPIHNGHMQLAETAERECDLQRILFLPAACPPHKSPSQLTSYRHRVEMIKIALKGRKEFVCSLVEADLPIPSYTVDTLRHLKTSLHKNTELFFLIGLDAFLEICTWKGYEELLRTVSFVVSDRAGNVVESKEQLARLLNYRQEEDRWVSREGKRNVYFLREPPLTISSSAIREALRAGTSILDMVPVPVYKYIMQHSLYCLNRSD